MTNNVVGTGVAQVADYTRAMHITLPNVLALDEARAKNRIRQIAERSPRLEGELRNFTRDHLEGLLFRSTGGLETVIIPKARPIPAGLQRVVEGAAALDAESLDLQTAGGSNIRS